MISDQDNKTSFVAILEQQYQVQKKLQVNQPFIPQINLFIKVRVEILAQIFVFLDIHSLLQLQLVNKICSIQITQIIPIYVRQLEQTISIHLTLENDVKAKVEQFHNIEGIQLQRQKIFFQVLYIQRSEISSLSKPAPYMVPEVLFFFCTLYDCTFNSKKELFRDDVCAVARKIMLNRDECLNQLLNFDISLISPQQLSILQQIYELIPEKIERVSQPLFQLYKLIKMITEFREQAFYEHKNQERIIHQKILKIKKEIDVLHKVIKKSQQ